MDEYLPILQVATLALKAARDQLPVLQAHRERCSLLLNRCERLLQEVAAQCEVDKRAIIQRKMALLESTCISVRDAIVEMAGKGLAWRLVHQERMEKALAAAEVKLTDAFFMFHVGAHVAVGEIQADIEHASKADHEHFVDYLDGISQNDQKIIDALHSNNLRLEETLLALMKHLQTRTTNANDDHPSEKFIRRAVTALQKVSMSTSHSVMPWQITSLEVEYERNEDECLGSGGFGKVFKGQWHGEVVAVKEMHRSSDGRSENHLKAFEKEIKIWLRLNHPRILPFYGACLESDKPFLVTKYCPNGNVMDYIREFPEVNRLLILYEVSVGMMYLHSQSVIHADLKAPNILIGDDGKALICDFGLSHVKDQVDSSGTDSIKGTLSYMAPEYLEGERIDFPVDVYSFAMTAWQIHTGLVPFSEVPRRGFQRWVIDRQERPEYPNSMNKALWNLIQECWRHEPSERPTFPEVEASLKPLVEPYKKSERRQSIPLSQILALSQMPTPPQSIAYEVRAPSPSTPATNEREWISIPPPEPIMYPVSSNSREVFRKTLQTLGEPRNLDKYIHETLLCYQNWLKYKVYNSRGPRAPHFVLKNRVKDAVKGFKKALLFWVDKIPSLQGVETTNEYRTLLLITGVCVMAESAHRQNPDAPHLYVQEFITTSINANLFRANVEGLVDAAWKQYCRHKDRAVLGNDLAVAVNRVC